MILGKLEQKVLM